MKNIRVCWRASRRTAFTLVELLVVVAIIALLVSMLMPSLARARELAKRTVCLTHLGAIGRGIHLYGADYNGFVIPCRYRGVQICLNPAMPDPQDDDDKIDWVKAAAKVGLGTTAWECPGRPGIVAFEPDYPQLILGYQYFGGIRTWYNPWGQYPARSPVDSRSRGDWVLAADAVMKIDGVWGGGRPTAFGNMPQHRWNAQHPEGGNQVHFDGSGRWVRFEEMYFIHSWGDWARAAYFYQKDLGDYVPPPDAKAKP